MSPSKHKDSNIQALIDQGRLAEALHAARAELQRAEQDHSLSHPDVTFLETQASLSEIHGLHNQADEYRRLSAEITDQLQPASSPRVAAALNTLAVIHRIVGATDDAERLLLRAIQIWRERLGEAHPGNLDIAATTNNLGVVYQFAERLDEAEAAHLLALQMLKKLSAPRVEIARTLNNLASTLNSARRWQEAEWCGREALAIRIEISGSEHLSVAASHNTLGSILIGAERPEEALEHLQTALRIRETTLGESHSAVATIARNMAVALLHSGRPDLALGYARKATQISQQRLQPVSEFERHTDESVSESHSLARGPEIHLILLARAASVDPVRSSMMAAEAYQVAQMMRSNSTSTTLAKVGARHHTTEDSTRAAIREHQDYLRNAGIVERELERAALKAPADREAERENALRLEGKRLSDSIAQLAESLKVKCPHYASLVAMMPSTLEETQASLVDRELLVLTVVGEEVTFVFGITKESIEWHSANVRKDEITNAVAKVRSACDLSSVGTIRQLESRLASFDLDALRMLSMVVISPIVTLCDWAQHILYVPDESLESLPIGMLLTEACPARPKRFSDFRDFPWLVRMSPASLLPAASSLTACRRFEDSKASLPFLGIGDPVIGIRQVLRRRHNGSPDDVNILGGTEQCIPQLIGLDGRVSLEHVRNLPSLHPEAQEELSNLGRSLGRENSVLLFGEMATVSALSKMDLTSYRLIAFVTHGLMVGEIPNLREAALVLTPPEMTIEGDDGLLRASQIANLRIDADCVILSCCNSAAANMGTQSEALSGMAKAFFLAGARSLLVTHSAIDLEASKRLSTYTFRNPGGRLAENLQQAMLALIEDPSDDHLAHPAFWAPFSIVGDGWRCTPEQTQT